jgi:hypothetical protein
MDYFNSSISHICSTIYVVKDKVSHYINNENPSKQPERISPIVNYYDQYTTCYSPPTYILDNIYLGSAYNAANYTILKDTGIDIIINITNEIDNYYPNDFIYHNYKIEDNEEGDLEEFLDKSYDVIKNSANKKVLVHCYMGASRSASLVIYYLIKEKKMSFDEAFDLLKSKRIVVNPNIKFVQILRKKEEEFKKNN